LPQSALCPILY